MGVQDWKKGRDDWRRGNGLSAERAAGDGGKDYRRGAQIQRENALDRELLRRAKGDKKR